MKKLIQDFKLIKNRRVNNEYYVLELQADNKLPELKPGQFAELRIDNSQDVFLRRPISLYDVDFQNNVIHLLIQEVGKGTRKLAEAEEGTYINMIYPLGNSFTYADVKNALLIGGGVGVAPLLYLGKYLHERGIKPTFILGFRSKDLLVDVAEFEKYGKVFITTDDGSAGEKGVVLNHSVLSKNLSEYDKIYTCGPEIMMKAVARFADEHKLDCEASLENTMACGFGACICCVQETVRGNLKVCEEGPVFNTKEIIW